MPTKSLQWLLTHSFHARLLAVKRVTSNQGKKTPAVEKFLSERGLKLSEEKTCITYIKHGFTFLGQTFRKRGNTLHVTLSKEGIQALISKFGISYVNM
ncbi:MAG: hypothetical protein D8M57_05590 [Candidatus Scalindua sp. AMX11]|nr:MAG: hypothetical protein DWQ00_07195 [Candidatus Scalindua sp.]NOG85921.1 hypothetical protein [Planctomycetota bacterium]RZV91444.1 MAG: hypothetical protein EX341_05840 [Candidatus Scalindua sp. SCAELEC01]TDE66006.1 MAG: hypothetical protein D8M57_05590 [Candidatus Scalindua sp. AMX11]